MSHKLSLSPSLLVVLGGLLCLGSPEALAQNVIRGATPGWPGNTAYYAPQNAYQLAPQGVVPVVQAQYAPQTSYYAPVSATRIAYAVPAAGSYQVTYAGANQPGVATTAYYGGFNPPVQRVAYYAPQVVYRPVAVVPVQYYRPVVAYQPAVVAPAPAAPATCGSAPSCGSGSGCGWRPFAWLWGGSCSKNTCYKAPCGTAAPYYTAPAIPVAPAPAPSTTVIPTSPFRNPTVTPGVVGGTVPPPPTRTPGTIITTPSTSVPPASTPPRLEPGTVIPSNPAPSTPYTPPPFNPAPSNPPPLNRDYRPIYPDPYSNPTPSSNNAPMLQPPSPSINPSGYTNPSDRGNLQLPLQGPGTITEPGLQTPPPSVQPLRDPDGEDRNRNRAPQLLSPNDRTAKLNQRWGVVPAVWPVKTNEVQAVAQSTPELEPVVPVTPQVQLDDSGWKSAR